MPVPIVEKNTISSELSVQLRIKSEDLKQFINSRLPDTLFQTEELGGKKLLVKAKKAGDIDLKLSGTQLEYKVPMHLEIVKKLSIGDLTASGLISLFFRTEYGVDPSWNFNSSTEVLNYEWLKAPRFKAGFMDFPIESIADILIKKGSEDLVKNIDRQLKDILDLKEIIQKVSREYSSLLLSENNQVFLHSNFEKIGLMPFREKVNYLDAHGTLNFKPFLLVGNSTEEIEEVEKCPDFYLNEKPSKESLIILPILFSYNELEKIVRQNAIGESFSSGKNKVKIEDLNVSKERDFIKLEALLSGSITGRFFIKGKPVFDKQQQHIIINELSFDLKTDNILMKGIGWIIKNTIKKTIEKNLTLFLQTLDKRLLDLIMTQIKKAPVPEGVDLNIEMRDFGIIDFSLLNKGLYFALKGQTEISCEVNRIPESYSF